ncbi:MAG: Isoprenyl transferase [Candidatus Amesbacteria bacterium GW2011_GWB1_47_26]|uniref:Isoprenyl transferase n=1 Tax=Candidatus Amesbacteria bacterium GW2011_GWC2_45_19 TaxID=1618366 RepID=A0A0G1Q256_9BACT|nr:MAG: Isoprenyl transferase [Candidatus Amesbacteria bacterium GW2011_GWC2_45_19]KKU37685.1 MAG: Isoprenyl transferase [Candidatus Amesbacteria bacterium GW2011_GWA1_46_35]KKU68466.1 MAG: Isoprenyl transferase [Microgenomates group bacterium GW2011_GWC1_47_20]KKU74191.1 MAG: Isoprenyl transferase [Candidatus Amesbacteria bacterium GW2011_GWB1_47_26]
MYNWEDMANNDEMVLPKGTKVPNHVAIILDGNRRWARARGLEPWKGHAAGYEAVKKLSRASRDLGVHTFTVWAFSTENWERPEVEVKEIMKLLRHGLDEMEPDLHKEHVRLVHLGRKDRLPKDVMEHLARLERETKKYGEEHVFNMALDYGGHDEIVRAINKVIKNKKTEVTAKDFEKYLDTADQLYPYVDLFIRTSGEQRTSGLLPWQLDYAEYYFVQDHLPDFSPEMLREAVLDFSRRRRRFGGNDAEKHLGFNPAIVADLEVRWRHQLSIGEKEKFRDLVVRYVKEHYGLSKSLAREAGLAMARALVHGQEKDWDKAKEALEGLYGILQKTLRLAFEPEVIARIEIDLWKNGSEESLREYLAEKFRFSTFQAATAAHLGWLAQTAEGEKKKDYLEKFYQALKERVA